MPRNEIAAIIGALLAVLTALGSARAMAGETTSQRFAPIAAAFLVGFCATWIGLYALGY